MESVVRRPVAWVVTVLLFAEALGIAAVNWFLGMVADRQQMSLAGVDPDVMETSSKAGAVVFGLYFALCAVAALLVAVRDRAPRALRPHPADQRGGRARPARRARLGG
ncbi:hypothetical protein GCM10020256_27630 [Streptomyces thermocoprophilus]